MRPIGIEGAKMHGAPAFRIQYLNGRAAGFPQAALLVMAITGERPLVGLYQDRAALRVQGAGLQAGCIGLAAVSHAAG